MFSKRHLLLVVMVMYTTSCSYFFGEKKDKSNAYKLSLSEKANVNCLKGNFDLLRDYFNLRRDNKEISIELRAMDTCINDAVKLFAKHTQGSNPNYYQPSEIHKFLSTTFTGYSYSSDLLIEAIKLKASLLGGSDAYVTKEEIKMLPAFISYAYQGLADLAPYRHLIFSNRQGDKWDDFAPAAEAFTKVVSRIKTLPQKKTGTFDYAAMVRLANYFIDEEARTSTWTKSFDLVNSIQSLLVKGQRDTIQIEQFNGLVDKLIPLYLSYVEFNKFLKDDVETCKGDTDCIDKLYYKDFSTVFIFPGLVTKIINTPNVFLGNKIEILTRIQSRILNVLRDGLAESGGISIGYVNDIIATLTRIQALPDFIQAETLTAMAPDFFGLWLNQKKCVGVCGDVKIEYNQIDTLIQLISDWKERQLWINSLGSGEKLYKKAQLRENLKQSKSLNGNLLGFQNALENVDHSHWTNYVNIGVKEVGYKDLVIFNKLYTLVKLFLTPFNDNKNKANIIDYYLQRNEAQYFYDWFRPLALELKLIDPRSRTSGKTAFIEINLFASHASKPSQMDFVELIEYFEMALSTSQRATFLMKNKFQNCRLSNTTDVFHFERLDASCFRKELIPNAQDYLFSAMPLMIRYFTSPQKTDYFLYLKNLEKASRQGLIVEEPFETDALRLMSAVSQYSESLFLRFNTEGSDDILTTEEIKRVMKHIVPNLRLLIQDSLDPKTVKTLYTFFPNFEENLVSYILKNSEIPGILTAGTGFTTGSGLAQLKIFKEWSELAPSWLQKDARTTRENIVMVISGLSAFARVTKIKEIKQIFIDKEIDFEKGIIDVNSPIFKSLAEGLSCSTLKDKEVSEWLFKNQSEYWKETLQYFDVKVGKFNVMGQAFGDTNFKLGSNDIPETGLFEGWEGAVTIKLIDRFNQDPLSQYCGIPYIGEVHKVSEKQ